MVDWYGQWTYDPSELDKCKWCDMDYVAHWIFDEMNYTVMIDLEMFISRMLNDYYEEAEDRYYAIPDLRPYPENLNIHIIDFAAWVYDQGGLAQLEKDCT